LYDIAIGVRPAGICDTCLQGEQADRKPFFVKEEMEQLAGLLNTVPESSLVSQWFIKTWLFDADLDSVGGLPVR
jgi:hypothetical protein